ncbi:GH3 auxin-responsive promoter family protein [Patescibacteria group bacterium]|nr:GH3 auxin-responsive promoter family protein [Patescibacteria group bacterium]
MQNIHTLRGQKHQFSAIRTISDFQARVPLVTYDDIQPHIESMMQGAKNVLWYGRVPFFSKSS